MGKLGLGLGTAGMGAPTFRPAASITAPATAAAVRFTAGKPGAAGAPDHTPAWAAQLPGPVKSTLPKDAAMEACMLGDGFFNHASVLFRASISGPESLGPAMREDWQAQQTESFGCMPCARKWTESTGNLFFSRALWYCPGVIPGFNKALP